MLQGKEMKKRPVETTSTRTRLWELIALFVRLGFTAFGGPAAHIAIFEDEVVRRRGWLTREQFLDLLGVTNLIPGPNSTEMVIHIGHRRAGILGMIVAGLSFILPASLIVGVCAWLYLRYGSLPQAEGILHAGQAASARRGPCHGSLPQAEGILHGVKPVVIAIIAQALWGLGKTAVKTRTLGAPAATGAVIVWLGAGDLSVLVLIGAIMAILCAISEGPRRHVKGLAILVAGLPAVFAVMVFVSIGAGPDARPFSLAALFLFFLKVGSVLYGSGCVLLAFIESSLVNHWEWITRTQLLDTVAIGQVTPGPLFTTAAFIGFLLAGALGAAAATAGIFLPSFIFVAISGPIIPRLRNSVLAGAFLDDVNAASLALIAVVTLQLGFDSLRDPLSIILALASAVLLLRFKLNSTWLILGGAIIGLVAAAI